MPPQTRYAKSGDVSIAYQVVGEGPRDLVLVPGWISNVEVFWEEPSAVRFLESLARFSRVILFDKRGTGLSDRVPDMPGLETRMDDVRAVMDAAGSERAALFGYSEGGPLCVLFAATYPDRASALITHGSYARRIRSSDSPWMPSAEEWERFIESTVRGWGGPVGLAERAPSRMRDQAFVQWWARFTRMSASPASSAQVLRMNAQIDVRHVLPSVRVPTLLLHPTGDRVVPVEASRYMAEHIPGAKLVELPGIDHLPFTDNAEQVLREIRSFLGELPTEAESDRVLATVVFTDIVGSTEQAVALGDRRWRELLGGFHAAVRREVGRFRGREIDSAGDGVLAAFDGPARAVRAACAVGEAVRSLGVTVRAGVHTGECEVLGNKLAGIAVHIGARVASVAGPDEVLVSSTVRDLVAGSGLAFADRGLHTLKGVPGDWHLFAVDRRVAAV
ncbi:MAG TPA: adenylate/guanylate cyclase domain-containing protein [Verrucomicrobiae bacterium]|jgi:pimeloyl-ACP methyl ester carboxylesterase|nr:adenylate/guanylate cyclase domain-containing protein [Verrucomicrobiae bacterium]